MCGGWTGGQVQGSGIDCFVRLLCEVVNLTKTKEIVVNLPVLHTVRGHQNQKARAIFYMQILIVFVCRDRIPPRSEVKKNAKFNCIVLY